MNNYLIYKITNKINGKSYIGKTNDFKRRMSTHLKTITDNSYDSLLKKALSKYGWQNFNKEIIESNLSIEQSSIRETYYIDKFRTFVGFDDCIGYNLTLGGEGGNTYLGKSENEMLEIKSKISKANKGENNGMKRYSYKISGANNGMYGKHHSKENKQIVRAKLKGKKRPPFSEEHKLKISEAKKGKNASNGKTVIAISETTHEKFSFDSIRKCMLFTNVHRQTIIKYSNLDIFIKGYKFELHD